MRGERAGAAELRWIAEFGDEPRRGLGPDPVDRREQRAEIVVVEAALDVPLEGAPAPPQQFQVLTGVANLESIDLAVVVADRWGAVDNEGLCRVGAIDVQPDV